MKVYFVLLFIFLLSHRLSTAAFIENIDSTPSTNESGSGSTETSEDTEPEGQPSNKSKCLIMYKQNNRKIKNRSKVSS